MAMNLPGTARRAPTSRRWLLTLLASATLVAAFTAREPLTRRLAQHWQSQLDDASAEDVGRLLRQISFLGRPGIPSLVAALGSPKPEVARQARRVLMEQIDCWKSLAPADAQPEVASLAEALAQHVRGFGTTARQDSAELAVRILRELPAHAEQSIVSACEYVLRASRPDQNALTGARPKLAGLPASTRPLQPLALPPSVSPLAGGGLPLELAAGSGAQAAAKETAEPARLAAEANAAASIHSQAPTAASYAPANPGNHSADRADGLEPVSSNSKSADLATATASPPDRLTSSDTVRLMRQLRAGSGKDAEAELRRHGFSDVHLELARQLFDPDPQVRRMLAERLPSLQSVNAVPWLLQLCSDEDPDVRRTAVTLLATTSDPTLRAEAERLARQDSDPRLKDQAQRMTKRDGNSLR